MKKQQVTSLTFRKLGSDERDNQTIAQRGNQRARKDEPRSNGKVYVTPGWTVCKHTR